MRLAVAVGLVVVLAGCGDPVSVGTPLPTPVVDEQTITPQSPGPSPSATSASAAFNTAWLAFDPRTANLGTVTVGLDRARHVELVNASSTPVTNLSVVIEGERASGFSIRPFEARCAHGTVPPATSCVATIVFSPEHASVEASAMIRARGINDGRAVEATVAVSALGTSWISHNVPGHRRTTGAASRRRLTGARRSTMSWYRTWRKRFLGSAMRASTCRPLMAEQRGDSA